MVNTNDRSHIERLALRGVSAAAQYAGLAYGFTHILKDVTPDARLEGIMFGAILYMAGDFGFYVSSHLHRHNESRRTLSRTEHRGDTRQSSGTSRSP